MTRILLRIFALASISCASPAAAASFVVSPGPGTPVQDAIDAASPGDTIRLSSGNYLESIVIDKSLRLTGPRGSYLDDQPPTATIVPTCLGVTTGITIAADDVSIRDLRVSAFSEYGIRMQGRDKIKLRNVLAIPNCSSDPPIATIDIDASTRVRLDDVWTVGFDVQGTAIRIAAIPANGKVRVRGAVAGDHAIGILIEDSLPGSVTVKQSHTNFGLETGILLRNSDGILIQSNVVVDNPDSGIEIDATSNGNFITRNRIEGSVADVVDAGSGNCWRRNTFTTGSVPPCP